MIKIHAKKGSFTQRYLRMVRLGITPIACVIIGFFSPIIPKADSSVPPEQLVFGGDANYPPFEWLSAGEPKGFNIDIEAMIGEIGGVTVEHRLADWPDAVRALETGAVDAMPMFASDSRKQKFLFSPPFYYVNHAIYARSGVGNVVEVADLAGRSVAVEHSSYAHHKIGSDLPDVDLITEANTLATLRAVDEGRADFAIVATISADRLIRSYGLGVRQVGPPFWPSPYAFAVRKDNVRLHQWLSEMQALVFVSGRYETVFQRWESKITPGATTVKEITAVLVAALVSLVILGAIGYLWSWYLRRAVAARTRMLSQELERRTRAEEATRYLSNYDAHTDLPKLHHFIELVNQIIEVEEGDRQSMVERSESEYETLKEMAAVKLTDLDRIIRTFGYSNYNNILQQFAKRLKASDLDAYGYLGREVFAVFGSKGVVGENLNQIISPLSVRGMEFNPLITWGSAYWPEHGERADDLIRRAETALAIASFSQKRSCTVYDPAMEPDPEDIQLLSDFSRTGGEELYATFQPQLDLRSGLITGAEALVRWNHSRLGHVSPGKFVPLLESSGLIPVVTERMLDQAVAFSADLRRRGYVCPISVNIAVYDLLEGNITETVSAALRRHNAAPEDLKLELTETGTFEKAEQVQGVLSKLDRLGIVITVDDFGTGFSSLSYLSEFPIQEVKIDLEFVRDMLRNTRHRQIVQSTIAMVHKLGMVAVAEGAEDDATIRALRDDGCDRVQGFAISKSLVGEDFRKFLSDYEARQW